MKLKRLNPLKTKIKSSKWYAHRLFASNVWQEIDDGHLGEILDDPKTPAVVMLDSCGIKHVSF